MWREHNFRIASVLTILFPVFLVNGTYADIALIGIACLFLAHSFLEKNWSWCREQWVQILALLWLYMVVRGLFAEHVKDALAHGLPFIRYIVFAAGLAHWTLADNKTRQWFQIVFTCVVIFAALDGLLQYISDYDLFGHALIHDPNAGHIRLSGPFPAKKPILGIMLAWLAFPALLPRLFDAQIKSRMLAFTGLLIVVAAIALSGERMALLLMLFGCVLAGLLLPLKKRIVISVMISIIAMLGIITIISPAMFERQITSTKQTLTHWLDSPYGRLLTSDLTLAKQHPVIGLGANQFRTACESLYGNDAERIALMCNTHPHNIWLEWLIEEGVIGFALFSAFIALVLYQCARVLPSLRSNPLFIGWLIAFILRVWPFMSTTNFFSRWGAPPFWLALGGLLVYTVAKGNKNADSPFTVQDTRL